MPVVAQRTHESPLWHLLHLLDTSAGSLRNVERALNEGVEARRQELDVIQQWERDHAGQPLIGAR